MNGIQSFHILCTLSTRYDGYDRMTVMLNARERAYCAYAHGVNHCVCLVF